MAFIKKAAGKPKIVKKRLADGTIREYSYARVPVVHKPQPADSLAALIEAWERSPEWARLSEQRKRVYTLYLRPLAPMGSMKAAGIDRRSIRTIRDAIAAQGRPGAAGGFLSAVRGMFAWAVKADWVPFNPAVGIDEIPGGHLPTWTQEMADQAIAELPLHLSRLVILALYSGQRRGDLIRMRWNAYDGAKLTLVQGKTGTPLVIPCHPALKAALDTWPRVATTILVNARGRPWREDAASRAIRRAIARIGFPNGYGIHGLRKRAATNLAEAGCTPHEIQAITGHRSLAQVSLYTAAVSQERLAGAAIIRLRDHLETTRKPTTVEKK